MYESGSQGNVVDKTDVLLEKARMPQPWAVGPSLWLGDEWQFGFEE